MVWRDHKNQPLGYLLVCMSFCFLLLSSALFVLTSNILQSKWHSAHLEDNKDLQCIFIIYHPLLCQCKISNVAVGFHVPLVIKRLFYIMLGYLCQMFLCLCTFFFLDWKLCCLTWLAPAFFKDLLNTKLCKKHT